MRYIRLIGLFIRASIQKEMAYRVNFGINLLFSTLSLLMSWVSLAVVFSHVPSLRGWDYPSTLALLGVYLVVSALRRVCLGPSLESLAGMDGEMWTGRFDFTLLRPVSVQFLASFREWRPFALVDLALGAGVIARAVALSGDALTPGRLGLFFLALASGVVLVYAVLLAFSALIFWNPGFLFTWLFDTLFSLSRYPAGIYPAWLRILLTWIVPVGLITTLPAEALSGRTTLLMVAASLGISALALAGASLLFRIGVRKYASASS